MANLKLIKLKVLLIIGFHCALNDFNQQFKISQITQALLYHQAPPLSQTTRVDHNLFSHQQQQLTNIHNNNTSDFYLANRHNNYQAPSRQQQQLQTSYLTARDSTSDDSGPLTGVEPTTDTYGCPYECHCNKVAQIADCSSRNLTQVPANFPKDIKRIRLERNNITEIGRYAFQGLRRLQRIDISNNNIYNIDPLAFSGGLQSLNSLILYSNKLEHLPANVFSELSQLSLLLLNANSLRNIDRELFQSLASLNLLSLYDNNIATLPSGTFDGLKSIKTIHLGKNPLNCDCQLKWLAAYLEANPSIETSEAKCEAPVRRKLSQLSAKSDFKCSQEQQQQPPFDPNCPSGCVCNGATVDCSRAPASESRGSGGSGGLYELPDVPDDVPVYVTRVHINDQRIKRIRQTSLFRRLANSQKLDLGNNKIIDIEDNAINGQFSGQNKAERVVFVLLENQHCEPPPAAKAATSGAGSPPAPGNRQQAPAQDACSLAPKVNEPQFDSACYNGGTCRPKAAGNASNTDYTCTCPAGFAGPLCEINVDDCLDHQCQNGAMCVDGVNSYRCICRDPTTSGEFCEQLTPSSSSSFPYATSSANSIAPLALPIISSSSSSLPANNLVGGVTGTSNESPQPIMIRSVDFTSTARDLATSASSAQNELVAPPIQQQQQQQTEEAPVEAATCKRVTQRKYYEDGNGCQSVRLLKLSECLGGCSSLGDDKQTCCLPGRIKRRRIRMQCSDGASYVKTIDLVKKCHCASYKQQGNNLIGGNLHYMCPAQRRDQQHSPEAIKGFTMAKPSYMQNYNIKQSKPASSFQQQEESSFSLPITRLDAVD